jgi:hypothetical protein
MLIKLKDIPFYYLNFEGYTERKANMEKLAESLNINALRISNSHQADLRQDRIAFGVIKLLHTAIEIGKYPFIMMDDDIEPIKDLPEFITIHDTESLILLGGSLYETGGYKPNMYLEEYNEEYYRIYYMLSMHTMVVSSINTANFLLESIQESLNTHEFLDVDLALRSKEKLYLTPKDGPYFYQNNYNEPITRFLWNDVKDSYLAKYL